MAFNFNRRPRLGTSSGAYSSSSPQPPPQPTQQAPQGPAPSGPGGMIGAFGGSSPNNPMQAQAPLSSSLPTFGGPNAPAGLQGPGPKMEAGTGPGEPAGPEEFDMDKMYQDIMGKHEASWGDKEKMIQQQGLMNQRRAANINASMGRSVGGGFAGMLGAAMMGTQNQLLGAKTQHDAQGRQLMLGQLDRKLQEKHRQEDYDERMGERELLYGGGTDALQYASDKDRRVAFQEMMDKQDVRFQDAASSEAAYRKWLEDNGYS